MIEGPSRLSLSGAHDHCADNCSVSTRPRPERSPAVNETPEVPVVNALTSLPTGENERPASASDVMQRPTTGIVFTIVSGPRAGEMLGTDDNEFFIGYHPDCFVKFSSTQYPHANARVLFRRSREGWCLSQVSGDPAFVNQQRLEGKFILRSGDIVRLSVMGPDIQFTLGSGGLAVKALVQRFLSTLDTELDRPSESSAGPLRVGSSNSVPVPVIVAIPIQSAVALATPDKNGTASNLVPADAIGPVVRRPLWMWTIVGIVSLVMIALLLLIMAAVTLLTRGPTLQLERDQVNLTSSEAA